MLLYFKWMSFVLSNSNSLLFFICCCCCSYYYQFFIFICKGWNPSSSNRGSMWLKPEQRKLVDSQTDRFQFWWINFQREWNQFHTNNPIDINFLFSFLNLLPFYWNCQCKYLHISMNVFNLVDSQSASVAIGRTHCKFLRKPIETWFPELKRSERGN